MARLSCCFFWGLGEGRRPFDKVQEVKTRWVMPFEWKAGFYLDAHCFVVCLRDPRTKDTRNLVWP